MSKETKEPKQPKALDLVLIDPRNGRRHRACYSSALILGVNEVKEGGDTMAQLVLVAGAVNADESFESMRERWLDAIGVEVVEVPAPTTPALVRPS